MWATQPAGTSCADDNKCDGEETCDKQGTCQPGPPKNVDDANPCTLDLCDPATGAVSHKAGTGCCLCASDADCDDANPCTEETCEGCACTFKQLAAGSPCDDSNACTEGDACDAKGVCKGTPISPCTP